MQLLSGIDLIRISRVEAALKRQGEPFALRVWTEEELADCMNKAEAVRLASLAARWAAKEAVAKALGTGLLGRDGVGLTDIAVTIDDMGSPAAKLSGKALQRYEALGGSSLSLSLTHDGDMAAAVCVMLCRENEE